MKKEQRIFETERIEIRKPSEMERIAVDPAGFASVLEQVIAQEDLNERTDALKPTFRIETPVSQYVPPLETENPIDAVSSDYAGKAATQHIAPRASKPNTARYVRAKETTQGAVRDAVMRDYLNDKDIHM